MVGGESPADEAAAESRAAESRDGPASGAASRSELSSPVGAEDRHRLRASAAGEKLASLKQSRPSSRRELSALPGASKAPFASERESAGEASEGLEGKDGSLEERPADEAAAESRDGPASGAASRSELSSPVGAEDRHRLRAPAAGEKLASLKQFRPSSRRELSALPGASKAPFASERESAGEASECPEGNDGSLEERPDLGQAGEAAAESPAYLLYTSGSTGRPKGVVVSQGNLKASNEARFEVYDLLPTRYLLVSSIAFDSSVAGLFWTLAAGGTLVIPAEEEARDPRLLAGIVEQEKVTSLLVVPSLYSQMLRFGAEALKSLEFVIVAGESCPPALIRDHFELLPETRLFNEYGPTEATVWATVHEMKKDAAAGSVPIGPVPIGRPIPGVRVEVLDAFERPVPAGMPGQLWISGPTVASGYWRQPAWTAERFQALGKGPGRRYRTGDRGAFRPTGELVFLGRVDEQIKVRGVRIEPGEIEDALLALPGVAEAAVVVRPLEASSGAEADQLIAFLRSSNPEGPSAVPPDWREELLQRLPAPFVPNRLVALEELPRLPNGKTDRRRLEEFPLAPEPVAGEAGPEDAAPVLDLREQGLLSLWEGLLGRTGLSRDENFFELGGHSLLVVEMTLALERDFEVRLSSAEVFAHPTVAQLAQHIEKLSAGSGGAAQDPPYQHLFPLQTQGKKEPFILAVPHFFSEMFATRFRGERPVYGLRGVSLREGGNRGRWKTLGDLGEELVDEIERRFPGEPVILAGYSFGASMAVEAARILEARGRPAQGLYLIAPMPLDFYSFGPVRAQLDALRQPLEALSFGEALKKFFRSNHPLTRRPYARLRRHLLTKPRRLLLCGLGEIRKLLGYPLTSAILHADVRLETVPAPFPVSPRESEDAHGDLQRPGDGDGRRRDLGSTLRGFLRGGRDPGPSPGRRLRRGGSGGDPEASRRLGGLMRKPIPSAGEPWRFPDRSFKLLEGVTRRIEPADPALREWFEKYSRQHRQRFAADLALVEEHVAPKARILEYGAVPLVMTGALAALGYEVRALDVAPERFAGAIEKMSLAVEVCDIEKEPVPFSDDSFDAVLFNELFEHLRIDPIFTLGEAHRVLRPGGVLLLSTPNLRSLRGLRALLLGHRGHTVSGGVFEQYEKIQTLGHMGHVREYTAREAGEFLERIGFRIEKVVYRGGHGKGPVGILERLAPSLRPFFSLIARKAAPAVESPAR